MLIIYVLHGQEKEYKGNEKIIDTSENSSPRGGRKGACGGTKTDTNENIPPRRQEKSAGRDRRIFWRVQNFAARAKGRDLARTKNERGRLQEAPLSKYPLHVFFGRIVQGSRLCGLSIKPFNAVGCVSFNKAALYSRRCRFSTRSFQFETSVRRINDSRSMRRGAQLTGVRLQSLIFRLSTSISPSSLMRLSSRAMALRSTQI